MAQYCLDSIIIIVMLFAHYQRVHCIECYACTSYKSDCKGNLVDCNLYSKDESCYSFTSNKPTGEQRTIKTCGNDIAKYVCDYVKKRNLIGQHCNYCKKKLCNSALQIKSTNLHTFALSSFMLYCISK